MPWTDTKDAFRDFAEWLNVLERNGEALYHVRGFGDIENARAAKLTGIIFGTQGARMLGETLKMLRAFCDLGLRVMSITYQSRGPFGDGCGEPKDGGLSELGEKLILEAKRLGILIDLSHVGRRASMETIELSEAPVCLRTQMRELCWITFGTLMTMRYVLLPRREGW